MSWNIFGRKEVKLGGIVVTQRKFDEYSNFFLQDIMYTPEFRHKRGGTFTKQDLKKCTETLGLTVTDAQLEAYLEYALAEELVSQ